MSHQYIEGLFQSRRKEIPTTPVPILSASHTCEEAQAEFTGPITPKFKNSEILQNLDQYLSHLDEDQKSDIKQVMAESSKVFGDNPTVTNLIEHDIEVLESSRPMKQRPYRVNPVKQELIKKEISYMKENGIIQDSASDWSSPCLLVPKSDGSYRLCQDYRSLNSQTVPDNYPLPRISDCVEKIGQAKFITKIDLLRGYYQIPLSERAKRISAFSTVDGFYQFNVMPFGLRNAPSTFQRLANQLVHGLEGCAVYLDDLVIFADNWSQHVQRLTSLLKRLQEANLTVNLAKSEFAKATLTYLGFEVGHGQIKPLEAKTKAIHEFAVPRTRKQLRRFLGMINFYRNFCPNLSETLAPLTSLTSPNTVYSWTDQCQAAFETAKSLLGSAPILQIPRFDRPFKLRTDASQLGAGALLFQVDDQGIEHPIAYYSKKFSRPQQAYATIEKEAFAIVDSLKHFAYYVQNGLPIEIHTDHNPLVFLRKMKNDNQRLLRWSLALSEYPIVIKHIPGKENVVADCLSRPPNWSDTSENLRD